MLNTMVAEELSEFYDELKDADDMDAAIKALVKKVFTEHQNIIFNGNNYAPEWVEEAERRGLLNLKSLPDAMEHFLDKKNVDLFVKNKICSADEIRARYEIELESYSKQINIEALTMIDMAKKNILPAVTSYVRDLTDTALAKRHSRMLFLQVLRKTLLQAFQTNLYVSQRKLQSLKRLLSRQATTAMTTSSMLSTTEKQYLHLCRNSELSVTQWKQKQLRNTGLILHTANFFSVCD